MGRKKHNSQRRGKPKRRKASRPAARSADSVKQKLARRGPLTAPDEPPEDAAVFDLRVRAGLPKERSAQAELVAQAIELQSGGQDDLALEKLRDIPRRSLYSDWKLLIRGLGDWYGDRFEAAEQAWARLDPNRRPGRIAATLTASRQETTPESPASVKLIRTLRVERPAIREASAKLVHLREPADLTISPETIEWLKNFVREYRPLERDLVRELEAEALRQAFSQAYVDLFAMATEAFRGPDHDPNLSLLRYHFHDRFRQGVGRAAAARKQYLEKDLPRCHRLSPEVRAAIRSQLHLDDAVNAMVEETPFAAAVRRMTERGGNRQKPDCPEPHFRAAVQAYPANRNAHEGRIRRLKELADSDDATVAERKGRTETLAAAMRDWNEALPEDIEPRLWLVDHLLENESLDEARPHVEWLQASRHEDPRVRATGWKWELLEARRLCRRKSWLSQVPQRLDAAQTLWPDWLPSDWLGYLWAAFHLRSGDRQAYQQQRERLLETPLSPRVDLDGQPIPRHGGDAPRGPLLDSVMMLAAAQRMRVPADEVRECRRPVDQAVARQLHTIGVRELLDLAAFFWDLHRTSLVYPAYRMHGSKFGRELINRLDRPRGLFDGNRKIPAAAGGTAALWMAEHRFWDAAPSSLPRFVVRARDDHPFYRAASLYLLVSANGRVDHLPHNDFRTAIDRLREVSPASADRFYRFWLSHLADRAGDLLERKASPFPFFGPKGIDPDIIDHFRDFFDQMLDDDEEDDDEEDDWDDDDDWGDGDFEERRHGSDPSFRIDLPAMPEFRPAHFEPAHFEPDRSDRPGPEVPDFSADDFTTFDFGPEPGPSHEPAWAAPAGRRGGDPPRDPEARRNRPKNPMGKKKGRRKR